MTHTAPSERVISARVELSPADHQRLLQVAASHERSVAQEVRWAVRQWLDQHAPVSRAEDSAS